MPFLYKQRFLKRFDRCSHDDQALVLKTDQEIRSYYATRHALFGLRIKLLYARGAEKIFEARVTQAIRLVWAEREGLVSFVMVGLHDEVKRYLRSLR